jgi:DNA mismatch endonuclease (patch repair protein)
MTSPRETKRTAPRGSRSKTPATLSLGEAVRVPYPFATSPSVTAVMKGNRSRDTVPEQRLRSVLHRHGYRFRKHYAITAGPRKCRADIVFTKSRVAVFVDGCFWHGCPEHGRTPKSNTAYWAPKLARNLERDRLTDSELGKSGWRVVRIWEHEELNDAVDRIESILLRIESTSEK